jgi:hypothetical protein
VTRDADRLRRWLDAGGTWRLVEQGPTGTIVALMTCDGGEEMERIVSADPAFADLVASL